VFALDLMSTYEGEHTIFGLLGQHQTTLMGIKSITFLMKKLFHKKKPCFNLIKHLPNSLPKTGTQNILKLLFGKVFPYLKKQY
jgi:hypothetical protein